GGARRRPAHRRGREAGVPRRRRDAVDRHPERPKTRLTKSRPPSFYCRGPAPLPGADRRARHDHLPVPRRPGGIRGRRRLLPGDLPRRPAGLPRRDGRVEPAGVAADDRQPQGDRQPAGERPPAPAGCGRPRQGRRAAATAGTSAVGPGRRPAREAARRGAAPVRGRSAICRRGRGYGVQRRRGPQECLRGRQEAAGAEGEVGMTREPREARELEELMTAAVQRATADFTRRAEAEDLVDVAYASVDSPFGPLLTATTDQGLVTVVIDGDDEAHLDRIAREISPRILENPSRLDAVRRELDEYFAGRRRDFDLPVDWRLIRGF